MLRPEEYAKQAGFELPSGGYDTDDFYAEDFNADDLGALVESDAEDGAAEVPRFGGKQPRKQPDDDSDFE